VATVKIGKVVAASVVDEPAKHTPHSDWQTPRRPPSAQSVVTTSAQRIGSSRAQNGGVPVGAVVGAGEQAVCTPAPEGTRINSPRSPVAFNKSVELPLLMSAATNERPDKSTPESESKHTCTMIDPEYTLTELTADSGTPSAAASCTAASSSRAASSD
jgi:hypothetical protein